MSALQRFVMAVIATSITVIASHVVLAQGMSEPRVYWDDSETQVGRQDGLDSADISTGDFEVFGRGQESARRAAGLLQTAQALHSELALAIIARRPVYVDGYCVINCHPTRVQVIAQPPLHVFRPRTPRGPLSIPPSQVFAFQAQPQTIINNPPGVTFGAQTTLVGGQTQGMLQGQIADPPSVVNVNDPVQIAPPVLQFQGGQVSENHNSPSQTGGAVSQGQGGQSQNQRQRGGRGQPCPQPAPQPLPPEQEALLRAILQQLQQAQPPAQQQPAQLPVPGQPPAGGEGGALK